MYRRTPWRPTRSGLLPQGEAIENLGGDAEDAWAPAPDEDAKRTLERLLQRIPSHLAQPLRLCKLEGVSQRRAGHVLGISQSGVHGRLQAAQARLRLVASLGVDLIPGEVEALLLQSGEAPEVATTVAAYWREHRTSACGVPQSTAWGRIELFVALRAGRSGPVGEVARAVLTIQGWPRPIDRARSPTDRPVVRVRRDRRAATVAVESL